MELGIVSVIQVGKPVKLKKAKELAKKEHAGFAIKKSRFDTASPTVK